MQFSTLRLLAFVCLGLAVSAHPATPTDLRYDDIQPSSHEAAIPSLSARQLRDADYGGGPGPADSPQPNASTPPAPSPSVPAATPAGTQAPSRKLMARSFGKRRYDHAFHPLDIAFVEAMLEDFQNAEPRLDFDIFNAAAASRKSLGKSAKAPNFKSSPCH